MFPSSGMVTDATESLSETDQFDLGKNHSYWVCELIQRFKTQSVHESYLSPKLTLKCKGQIGWISRFLIKYILFPLMDCR